MYNICTQNWEKSCLTLTQFIPIVLSSYYRKVSVYLKRGNEVGKLGGKGKKESWYANSSGGGTIYPPPIDF